jgi:uncharacterized protein
MPTELILTGIIGGTLGGLLGIGGGSIYVPALTIFLGLSQQMAQGTALVVMIPVSILGSYTYLKKGYLNKKILPVLIVGCILGALLGSGLAQLIDAAQLRKIFSAVLFLIGVKMCAGK